MHSLTHTHTHARAHMYVEDAPTCPCKLCSLKCWVLFIKEKVCNDVEHQTFTFRLSSSSTITRGCFSVRQIQTLCLIFFHRCTNASLIRKKETRLKEHLHNTLGLSKSRANVGSFKLLTLQQSEIFPGNPFTFFFLRCEK